jgi:nucleoside phosphorylase
MNPDLQCDAIIFVTTGDELDQLTLASAFLGLPFEPKNDLNVGEFYSLGTLGSTRVIAARTRTGSHDFRGSASQAALFKAITPAKLLIQIGMAFGVDPINQKAGEVLVSTSVFPYDRRDVKVEDGQIVYKYTERTVRRNCSPVLEKMFRRAYEESRFPYRVHFGMLLSGGARIYSRDFKNKLLAWVPTKPMHPIVGGEMEGVGVLAASDPQKPCWIVVKGISDFADEEHDLEENPLRPVACRRSALFVLRTLLAYPAPIG